MNKIDFVKAAPCFDDKLESERLTEKDAEFVDVIHTSRSYGLEQPIGHADFYPNNGMGQPGCGPFSSYPLTEILCGKEIDFASEEFENRTNSLLSKRKIDKRFCVHNLAFACSHQRAYSYFIESITNRDCEFTGYKCKNWETFEKNECLSCETNTMGFYSKKPCNNTIYYLNVNPESLFCVGSSASTYTVNLIMSVLLAIIAILLK